MCCRICIGKSSEDTYGNTYNKNISIGKSFKETYANSVVQDLKTQSYYNFFFARSAGQYFPEVVILRDICIECGAGFT